VEVEVVGLLLRHRNLIHHHHRPLQLILHAVDGDLGRPGSIDLYQIEPNV
jgi:hypothetical protein